MLLWHTHTQAEDILELLLTNGMQYDMACAMDYTYFRMYDMWVTRDLNVMNGGHHSDTQPPKALPAAVSPPVYVSMLVIQGDVPSAWYPYIQESVSRSRVRQGLPFRVYSCWNGAVVLPGEVLVKVP